MGLGLKDRAVLVTDDKLLERLMVKTLGAMRCTRAAMPYLRASDQGHVICIGASRTVVY